MMNNEEYKEEKEPADVIMALRTLVSKYETVEYIKLIKNSRGYNWEIKQLNLNIPELVKINTELDKEFGGYE